MPDVLLLFSLGPVQGFLAEARRSQDLWVSSKWLSDLTRAAIRSCQYVGAKVIYPANPEQPSLPNKFVARLPEAVLQQAIAAATTAAQQELEDHAKKAKEFLQKAGAPTDAIWEEIWQRQIEHHLEFFWSANRIKNGNYESAYEMANRTFEAAKRTRVFAQVQEDGWKDSLSGRRSALRTGNLMPREYWQAVATSGQVTPAQLKPDGRERLDALGATKRFGFSKEAEHFPSVSSVAAADFLERAGHLLEPYCRILEQIPRIYKIRVDKNWPYDGDLLFIETLAPERLKDSYAFDDEDLGRYATHLKIAHQTLTSIYKLVGKPIPYYALLVLDGDNMGKRVAACANEEEHAALSQQLVAFAGEAQRIVKEHMGQAIYAGGDDVLALLPLSLVLPAAQTLADTFAKTVPGGTVSAGVAIVHHLYPLDAALRASREAEQRAKDMRDKNAVCVRVLKRSGEPMEVRSYWVDLSTSLFEDLCRWFADGAISSRFAYEAANNLPILKGEPARSELKRLIQRHRDKAKINPPDPILLSSRLDAWMKNLPGGAEELAGWFLLACFVAQGGSE
ncbi:MAG: type III-B CRISPR-associated protein Cas10/Cmr2 [Methanotrichaceae archaeon]